MKVILLTDVRGVGRKFDVKNVADGYAMNYLFPRKLAEGATDARLREIEAMRQKKEAEAAALEEALLHKIDSLRGAKIEIKAKATPKGGLFKAVDEEAIARAIREQKSLEIPEDVIQLSHPLKTIGEHMVKLVHKTKRAEIVIAIKASSL